MSDNDIADAISRSGGNILGSAARSHAFMHMQKAYLLGDTAARASTLGNSVVAGIMYVSPDKTNQYAFNPTAHFT